MYRSTQKCICGIFKAPNERGIALGLVLGYGFVLSILAAGIGTTAVSASRMVRVEKNRLANVYIAEAATEKSMAQLRLFLSTNGRIPTQGELNAMAAQAPKVAAGAHTYQDTNDNNTLSIQYAAGGWTSGVLAAGDYSGLNGQTRTINVSVTARDTRDFTGAVAPVTLTQTIQVQLIPLFQFGVFYENDLEILPGAAMTFTGRVHSNKDIYVGADGSTLNFQSAIDAYGKIVHGRKDSGNAVTGDVWIRDADGVDQNMKGADGTWLDSNHVNWFTESQTRWDGNVLSSVHNTKQLKLPIPVSQNNHVMIERRAVGDSAEVAAQKMDYKAHLRIIDGQVMTQGGLPVDLRYCANGSAINNMGTPANLADDVCSNNVAPLNPISNKTFFNFRENKTIQSTDLDIAILNNSPAYQTYVSSNGVILYHSDKRNLNVAGKQDALRLVNGSTLSSGGLTVASENPVYVKGHYNTVSKKPSGIVSDAFNILSTNWNDANSALSLANRTAAPTTVNTAVITGNKDTSSGSYNGGFENIHRFLENWSGKTLTYKGSVIVLYNSTIATGNWTYGGNFYTAPNRSWSFDTDFDDPNYFIPGFPSVFNVVKADWQLT